MSDERTLTKLVGSYAAILNSSEINSWTKYVSGVEELSSLCKTKAKLDRAIFNNTDVDYFVKEIKELEEKLFTIADTWVKENVPMTPALGEIKKFINLITDPDLRESVIMHFASKSFRSQS